MIGVFDSGAGGLLAVREIRRLSPYADVVFFADRQNAPYGMKTKDELIELVKADIELLRGAGADKILMACCTASTVHEYLPYDMREIACPIILPTAKRAAAVTECGNIGVIATRATVASGAFRKALSGYQKCRSVYEFEAQNLVELVESGCTDESITEREFEIIKETLSPLADKKIDTLILGCTHFPHIEKTISKCLQNVKTVSSAYEGAFEILKKQEDEGEGKTLFL